MLFAFVFVLTSERDAKLLTLAAGCQATQSTTTTGALVHDILPLGRLTPPDPSLSFLHHHLFAFGTATTTRVAKSAPDIASLISKIIIILAPSFS